MSTTTLAPPLRGLAGRLLLLSALLASGCASTPRAPAGFDLGRSVIVSDPSTPALVINGPSGKGVAAGAGAAKGAGTGLGLGTLACLGTGFMFPLCVATVVPTTVAVGAVGWAATSAAKAESAEGVALQRGLLTQELAAVPYPARLAEELQQAARARLSTELPIAAPEQMPAGEPGSLWIIEVALTELASEAHDEGKPYALRFEGRLRLRRPAQAEPVYEQTLEVATEKALTTADWAANESETLHAALGQAVQSLAAQLLSGLAGGTRSPARGAAST